MEFRWIILLTLWTMLIGPVVNMPLSDAKARSHANAVGRSSVSSCVTTSR